MEWNNRGKVRDSQLDPVNVGFLWAWDLSGHKIEEGFCAHCHPILACFVFNVFFDTPFFSFLCYEEALQKSNW